MARREADRYVVVAPATMPVEERERTAAQLVERLERRLARRAADETDLLRRAADLSRRYLGGRAHPRSVSWVDNQHHRWGSATPATRTIRLSRELSGMPAWVVDSVLVHELAHLLVADHGPSFQRLVAAYPRTAEARAFLAGVSWARSRGENPLPAP
jgi:predicted metal-dependent hydrolase